MKKLKAMKKTIYKYFVPVLFFVLALTSCDDYLDVEPKGVQVLKTTNDYDLWLNSDFLKTSIPRELNLLADNIDNIHIQAPFKSADDRMYTWQLQFLENVGSSPVIWVSHYQSIYYFNTVIEGIDAATGGTEEQKKILKAEALLGRAFEYLYLVNLYGKVYDANTAEEDLAVPFVTSNDLTDASPERSSVQDIYEQIIMDIETAISDLPGNNGGNLFRGSVAAAYSVLARTYLYMGDYTKAAQNAQLALDNGPNTILDYSTMADAMGIPLLQGRPDAIYARYSTNYGQSEFPTTDFLQSFDIRDLRLKFFYSTSAFYSDLGDYSFTIRGEIQYQAQGIPYANANANYGTSVAEMRLILAESAARSNNLGAACDELDSLRKCRFPADTYVKFESTNQEEVLQKVLAERTFEFPYNGLRWFDMRRLDAEGRMPAVNRYDGGDNVISTLSPGSAKYTLQIPIQVLHFNPEWPQNPTDE